MDQQFDAEPDLLRHCDVGGGVNEVTYRCNHRHHPTPEAIIKFVEDRVHLIMEKRMTPSSMMWVVLIDEKVTIFLPNFPQPASSKFRK